MSWGIRCAKGSLTLILMSILVTVLYTVGLLVRDNNTVPYAHRGSFCSPYKPVDVRDTMLDDSENDSFADTEDTNLIPGGRYKPLDCEARHHVAVIVPYRDRENHLELFLRHMHPFLQRQNLDYGIFVIELVPGVKFNRGLLMNVGFYEVSRQYDYDCFIFHDVDLLPENEQIQYSCTKSPVHLSVAIDSKNYKMPYENYFGGVGAISKQHYTMINGFSNMYFDWGGEDDDILERLISSNLKVHRPMNKMGRYKMLSHPNAKQNPQKDTLSRMAQERYLTDGLNSLKYRLEKYELKRLYTWILVSVNETTVMSEHLKYDQRVT